MVLSISDVTFKKKCFVYLLNDCYSLNVFRSGKNAQTWQRYYSAYNEYVECC